MKLLSRNEFKKQVFTRDNGQCVFCDKPATDAHHIIDRSLFPDGGYYLDNGVAVCNEHHLKCETTDISTTQIRNTCKIKNVILPPHLYLDSIYDKWGNIELPNGTRLKGEIFFEDNVQKMLQNHLHLFREQVKYPRTYHLPWSPGATVDDKVLSDVSSFIGKDVVISIKMDGESSSVYPDYFHARSIDSDNHESRNWVKNYCARFQHDIPKGWRVCFENLYALHTIHYHNLTSYINGISIWNEFNVCLNWDNTLEWFQLFDIPPVPILYRGIFDVKKIREIESRLDLSIQEGYVIRLASEFKYQDFKTSVAKFVRKGHVVDDDSHWKTKKVIRNGLAVQ